VLAIAVRNGILLVRHLQRLEHEEHEEGEAFGARLVLRGAQERLVPVALSASATALALLPLALLGGVPGLEVVRPLAVVVLGGLTTAALVSLLILPFLYLRFAPRPLPAAPAAASRPSPPTR
jgi:Cu/Ag efflux pump CusA